VSTFVRKRISLARAEDVVGRVSPPSLALDFVYPDFSRCRAAVGPYFAEARCVPMDSGAHTREVQGE
jgi:hypothetical protein